MLLPSSTPSLPNKMAELNSGSPVLSIVIPSHRRVDLLQTCLMSVTRFAPAGTQIVVVDDGSPGATVALTAARFAKVTVVRLARPGGFCAAANAGVALAKAPIVELLNDDTEVTAGWADAALRWFSDPSIAAVAPLVLQRDPDRLARGLPPRIDTAGDEYDFGGFARKRGHGLLWINSETPTAYNATENRTVPCQPGRVMAASACAAFYRREALLQAGGFPVHFQAYFEDVDLSLRLRRQGFEIVFDPASVVWHRVSSSYSQRPRRRLLEQQSCNEERLFWRNSHGQDRLRWLPRHAAVLAAKAVRRFQEGSFLPWFLGRIRAAVTQLRHDFGIADH